MKLLRCISYTVTSNEDHAIIHAYILFWRSESAFEGTVRTVRTIYTLIAVV